MKDIINIKKIKDDIFLSVKKSLESGRKEYELKEEFFNRVYKIKDDINSRFEKPVIYDNCISYKRKSLNEYIQDYILKFRYKFTTKIDIIPMYNDTTSVFKGNKSITLEILWGNIEKRFNETIGAFEHNKKNHTLTRKQHVSSDIWNSNIIKIDNILRNIDFINYITGRKQITQEEKDILYKNIYYFGKKYQIGSLYFRAYKNKKFIIYLNSK